MSRGFHMGGASGATPGNYIYKDGNPETQKTGGWGANGWTFSGAAWDTPGTLTPDYMGIDVNQLLATVQKISLANISQIRIKADVLALTSTQSVALFITNNKEVFNGAVIYKGNFFNQLGVHDFYQDVSNLNGEYYIGITSPGSNRRANIYEIELVG